MTASIQVNSIYDKIKNLTKSFQGKILSTEYGKGSGLPQYITIELPTANHHTFVKELKQVGEFQNTLPLEAGEGKKFVTLKIKFVLE
ncbi:MAG: hypothetical protein ABH952_10395 [Candidatus Omnitrophota bacterium]